MMSSRYPKFLFWGPELVQIFNDAYRPSLGSDGRHILALGARAVDFWTEIWSTIGPQIEQVMQGGPATWHEDQLLPIFRNGRMEDVYWTYSYSAAHDDNDQIYGALVVCQETTAQVVLRKQLDVERTKLTYAFQQAPSFVAIMHGPPYVFDFVNEAYTRLLGDRALVGRKVFDVVPEAREQGFEALLDNVVATGIPYVGREMSLRLARSPGAPLEEHFLDFVYLPLLDADGRRSGVIAHGVDITDHVETRREVERLLVASNQARAEADRANRTKGDFLAMLSHELRTPLAAISGYAELLGSRLHGPLSDQQGHYLHRIQHNQRHLLGLIDGLLAYAQTEAGTTQYHLETVTVRAIVASCEALTLSLVQARQLEFTKSEIAPEMTVYADGEKTTQILVNLVGNAIKFTEPGGRISIECSMDGAERVRITVRDTGRGISDEDITRIFEPFVQLRAHELPNNSGAGLGLPISHTFARAMGGELTVESTVGVGSAFTLTLPARPPA